MADAIPRYVADPLLRFFDYLEESGYLLHLSMHGISVLRAMPTVVDVLGDLDVERAPKGEEQSILKRKESELERAKAEAALAEEECQSGFPLLHAHTLVGMWGADAFEMLLESVKLAGDIDPEVRKTMWEMHQVRNVVVHRGSLADRRLVECCPWLQLKVGAPVVVIHPALTTYSNILGRYVMTIVRRLGKRYDVDIDKKIAGKKEIERDTASPET